MGEGKGRGRKRGSKRRDRGVLSTASPLNNNRGLIPDRPLHTSVRRLSTAASSIRYSASLGGSPPPK